MVCILQLIILALSIIWTVLYNTDKWTLKLENKETNVTHALIQLLKDKM